MAMADKHGFAPPPFKPEDALQRLKRELRDMGLVEREGVFERRGLAIARIKIDASVLAAAIVERPVRASPRWRERSLSSSAAARDFSAEVKKALAAWGDRDD